MKRKFILSLAVALNLAGTTFAMKPVTIVDQGSFMAGGKIITAVGAYNTEKNPKDLSGNTLHGDHAYVFYQIPKNHKNFRWYFCTVTDNRVKVGRRRPTVVTAFKIFSWRKNFLFTLSTNRAEAEPVVRLLPEIFQQLPTTNFGITTSESAITQIFMIM